MSSPTYSVTGSPSYSRSLSTTASARRRSSSEVSSSRNVRLACRIFAFEQVDDLVIDAQVDGTDLTATIGEGSGHDLFLEAPTTSQPVLFHDLNGDDWKEVLRRKLAPHLAVLLENTAYTATLALFLLAEGDADREEALHDLGITADDVDALRTAIGAVSEEDRQRQRRWFSAIVATLQDLDELPSLELENVGEELVRSGAAGSHRAQVVERGGGTAVRADVSPDGVLSVLAE